MSELDRRSPALRTLLDLSEKADADTDVEVALSVPVRAPPGRTVHLRYAVPLAACALVAYIGALLPHGPRGYWLPMTAASSTSPTSDPLCAGPCTAAPERSSAWPRSVAAALLTDDSAYTPVGTVAVYGALMAVGVRHHYPVATTGLTRIAFVLVDLLGDHRPLYGTRILDITLTAPSCW